jgi:hypothetical protein
VLLAAIGALRLARTARARWRISLACCGVLLEVLGHSVLAGPAREPPAWSAWFSSWSPC